MQRTYPSIFLVELMSHLTGELEDADLFARLDTAVEKAYLHACGLPSRGAEAEVSTDDSGTIDGVGFFDEDKNLIACVTVYCLEHDTEEPSLETVRQACANEPVEMQTQLNQLLRA